MTSYHWQAYGLNRDPFELSESYISQQWYEVSELAQHLCQHSNKLVAIYGPNDSGKTTFARFLHNELITAYTVHYNSAARLPTILALTRTLKEICELSPENPSESAADTLLRYLEELHLQGRQVVFILDDAHQLSDEFLSGLLWLCEQQDEATAVLHFVLCGEPQLENQFKELTSTRDPGIVQFLPLQAFTLEEMTGYLKYCFEKAGSNQGLPFETAELTKIHKLSSGVIGRVNQVTKQFMHRVQPSVPNSVPVWSRQKVVGGVIIAGVLVVAALGLSHYHTVAPEMTSAQNETLAIPNSTDHTTTIDSVAAATEATSPENVVPGSEVAGNLVPPPNAVTDLSPNTATVVQAETNTAVDAASGAETVADNTTATQNSTAPATEQTVTSPNSEQLAAHNHDLSEPASTAMTTPSEHAAPSTPINSAPTTEPLDTTSSSPTPTASSPETIDNSTPLSQNSSSEVMALGDNEENKPVMDSVIVVPNFAKNSAVSKDDKANTETAAVVPNLLKESTNKPHPHPHYNQYALHKGPVENSSQEKENEVKKAKNFSSSTIISSPLKYGEVRTAKPLHENSNTTLVATDRPSKSSNKQDAQSYTIQLLASSQLQAIKSFLQQHQLKAIRTVKTERAGQPWYILTYGRYPDYAAAKKAIQDLPASLRQYNPWPRLAFKTS